MSNNKVAYIDIDQIMSQSIVGKLLEKKLKALNNTNISKFEKKKKELAERENAIIKKQNILSKEDFELKVKTLQNDIKIFKKNVSKSRKDLNKKRVGATNEILKVLNPILSEYSSKNSISLIIQKKNIVMGKAELDITKQILDLINKKIKTVKLN